MSAQELEDIIDDAVWEQEFPFKVLKVLGKGTFGTVWSMLWTDADGETNIVAVKRIRMQECLDYHEANLLESIHHPNIIKLKDKFYSYSVLGVGHLNLVFEYVPGGSLLDIMDANREGLDTKTTWTIFEQLLRVVDFLHSRNLVHRDLKPANVMIRYHDTMVKLIDFGHAKYLVTRDSSSKNSSTSYCVSRYYRPPELLLGNINYGVKVDVWSLGCILAEMLLGTPLFPGADEEDQMMKIVAVLGSPTLPDLLAMAPHLAHPEAMLPPKQILGIPFKYVLAKDQFMFVDLLSHMLVYDPSKRWSTEQLLRHPIFASED